MEYQKQIQVIAHMVSVEYITTLSDIHAQALFVNLQAFPNFAPRLQTYYTQDSEEGWKDRMQPVAVLYFRNNFCVSPDCDFAAAHIICGIPYR